MQFRVQGAKVYLLRSVYDKVKQRCFQKTVGKLDRYALPGEALPKDLYDKLTEDEQREVSEWVAEKRAAKQAEDLDWDFRCSGKRLKRIAEVLSSDETPEITQALATEIHEGIVAIQRVLKRAGWAKSKLPRKSSAK